MGSNAKLLRGQIRQVVKEVFPELFTKETQDTMLKSLSSLVNTSLEQIKKEVLESVERSKEKTRLVENEILTKAGEQLDSMQATMSAWQTLVNDELELTSKLDKQFKDRVKDLSEKILQDIKAARSSNASEK